MGAPTDRRERKKLANREALREAGLKLFLEKGYAATSLRDITDAADLGLRTFYRHFATKEDLLLDEVRRYLDEVEEILTACPPASPPVECFQEVLAQLEPRWSPPFDPVDGLLRPLYEIGESHPDVIARFHYVVDQHVDRVMHLFAKRLDVEPETLEPRLYAYLSRTVLSASLYLYGKGKEPGTFFDIARRVLTRLADGLDQRPASSPT